MKDILGFVHCRKCTEGGQTQRLEVGLTKLGIGVGCKKHGLVVHFTPELLAEAILDPPGCDLCARGEPHVH